MRDFYRDLDLAHNATQDEIRTQYRRLAKEFHPDRNIGSTHAAERMKNINEAYSILGQESSRKKYDSEMLNFRRARQRSTQQQSQSSGSGFGKFMSSQVWSQVRGFANGMAQAVVDELQQELEDDREEVDPFILDTTRLSSRNNAKGLTITLNISPSALKKITEFASRGMDLDDYCADVGVHLAEELSSQIMDHWRGF
jgi:DnaJ-class molecular chaperone